MNNATRIHVPTKYYCKQLCDVVCCRNEDSSGLVEGCLLCCKGQVFALYTVIKLDQISRLGQTAKGKFQYIVDVVIGVSLLITNPRNGNCIIGKNCRNHL